MTDEWTGAITESSEGAVLALAVTPGAKNDLFPSGYNPWRTAILCQVHAVAMHGKANQAVLSLIATTLGVPSSAVTILSGHHSSRKQVLIHGLGRSTLIALLTPFFSPG
jgi:uncharacterized protein (TIGR00251 family)